MKFFKKYNQYFQDTRYVHRRFTLIILLPLLLATITGTVCQIVGLEIKIMSSNRY
jgi:hypothetical protein